jgi:hypothetical protein
MNIPVESNPRSQTQPERTADDAAKKVRRSAEIHDEEEPTDIEKNEAASGEFEAHAELERNLYHKGHPGQA